MLVLNKIFNHTFIQHRGKGGTGGIGNSNRQPQYGRLKMIQVLVESAHFTKGRSSGMDPTRALSQFCGTKGTRKGMGEEHKEHTSTKGSHAFHYHINVKMPLISARARANRLKCKRGEPEFVKRRGFFSPPFPLFLTRGNVANCHFCVCIVNLGK